jgi:SAM-dependent methyltransferase
MGIEESRGEFLVRLIDKYARHDSAILEIGCKSGKNLYPLAEAGYGNLTGLEADSSRLERLDLLFPGLKNRVRVIEGPVVDRIRDFDDGGFELVFSVGYFEDDAGKADLLDEMARVSSRFTVTIEDERGSPGETPRNYRPEFERRGFEQMEEIDVSSEPGLESVFLARVFQRRAG